MKAKILTVDDREGIRLFIKNVLESAGHEVDTAVDGLDALQHLKQKNYHLLITDLKMPRMDGLSLLKKVKESNSQLPVIVLTAHGTIQNAVEAMKEGAFDYLTKPLDSPQALRHIVQRALGENPNPLTNTIADEDMIADSEAMKKVVTILNKVAPTTATVLLTGQSGTGKEVAAKRIHQQSQRNEHPFVPINCAAISPQLIESELFGHEKGSFTGAYKQQIGRFELADHGTLFLDEVGELPLELQAKLLRVLQEKRLERVGGSTSIDVDVRIIAATNRNLSQEVATGGFREDLYHRLSVFPIHLPPLIQRRDDILSLASFFLKSISIRQQIETLELSKNAAAALLDYHWPGNIRELGNTLERAAIMCTPPTIDVNDLLLENATSQDNISITSISPTSAKSQSLKQIEKEAIERALLQTDGHRKKAAELLGIGLRTLYNKLKEYGIE